MRERVERNPSVGAREPALENEAADDDACQESGKHQSEGVRRAAEDSGEKACPRDFVGDGGSADDSEGKEQKAARRVTGIFGGSFGGDACGRSLRGCGSLGMGRSGRHLQSDEAGENVEDDGARDGQA